MPLHVLRFTGIEEFSPDGLLRRYIAIDVPAASLSGFEEFFVIAFKIGRFSRCRRETRRRRT
jgi:hypothetical protein